jgi:hypothetical protein
MCIPETETVGPSQLPQGTCQSGLCTPLQKPKYTFEERFWNKLHVAGAYPIWGLPVPGSELFGFPRGSPALYIGCSRKVGVSFWNQFLIKTFVHNKTAKLEADWISNIEEADREVRIPFDSMARAAPIVIITRNPYSRFLSAMLDKGPPPETWGWIKKSVKEELLAISALMRPFLCHPRRFKRSGGAPYWNNLTLTNTTDDLLKCLVRSNSEHLTLNANLNTTWAQVVTPRIFKNTVRAMHGNYIKLGKVWPIVKNGHFWPQIATVRQFEAPCNDTYPWRDVIQFMALKIENEVNWHLCLMRALGVTFESIATGFRGFKRPMDRESNWETEDCLWHPPGQTCDWYSRYWNHPARAGNNVGRTMAGYRGNENSHTTAAASLMATYYCANSASQVADLYADDFTHFKYSTVVPQPLPQR